MTHRTIALASGLLGLLVPAAFGFSNDGSTLTRSLDRTVALTNSAVTVTITVTNTGTNIWRGFWYADQVPSGLAVATLSVALDGRAVTNYTFEAGQDGDVYPGCTPCRWVLETPPAFAQTNPVPLQSAVQIVLTISSSAPGAFDLQQIHWSGYGPAHTNAVFGYRDNTNQNTVNFLSTPPPPASLAGHRSTNGFRWELEGLSGASYTVQASTNLIQWLSFVTNTCPFGFIDTNTAGFSRRFYRGLWRP